MVILMMILMIMILSPRHTYIYTCTCNDVYCIQYTSSQAQARVQCVHPNPQACADKHTCAWGNAPTNNKCTPGHIFTDTQKGTHSHTVTQSAMILDRSNYSVNFNVRLTKIFFFGYLFLPFFCIFTTLLQWTHTFSIFERRGQLGSWTSGERLPQTPQCSVASPSRSRTSPSLASEWDLVACVWFRLGLF